MKTDWKAESPILAVLATMWGMAAWAWPRVSDQIPVHFNLSGQADRFGGRAEGLLLLPAMATVLYVLSIGWPRIDPHGERFALFRRPYAIVRLSIASLGLVIYAAAVASVVGWPVNVGGVIAVAGGIAMTFVGNYLPKTQPNWIFGVRTPWTLSSDLSWRRTHRLGGPLFVASGIVTVSSALLRPDWGHYVMLGSVLATAAVCIPYSYYVWRQDPQRGSDGVQRLMN